MRNGSLFSFWVAISRISIHHRGPKLASAFSRQSAHNGGLALNMHNVHSSRLLCVAETARVYYP